MPGLVDDRILALSDRFLLPLSCFCVTYASFMLLPFANVYYKTGSQALFVVIVFFAAWFLSRSTGFFLDVPYKKEPGLSLYGEASSFLGTS